MTFGNLTLFSLAYFLIKSKLKPDKVLKLAAIPAGAVLLVAITCYKVAGIPVESTFTSFAELAQSISEETYLSEVGGMTLLCGVLWHVGIGAVYAFAIGKGWAFLKSMMKGAEKKVSKAFDSGSTTKSITSSSTSYLPSGDDYYLPDDYQ